MYRIEWMGNVLGERESEVDAAIFALDMAEYWRIEYMDLRIIRVD